MILTFTGIIKAIPILVLSLVTVLLHHWPKDRNGKKITLEEFTKIAKQKKLVKADKHSALLFLFFILSTFTIFAFLLS